MRAKIRRLQEDVSERDDRIAELGQVRLDVARCTKTTPVPHTKNSSPHYRNNIPHACTHTPQCTYSTPLM